jgi:hypothetical protein
MAAREFPGGFEVWRVSNAIVYTESARLYVTAFTALPKKA